MVDHSTVSYPPFRRSFYTETGALARMTEEEVAAYRKELEDIKVTLLPPSFTTIFAGALILGDLPPGQPYVIERPLH